MTIEEQIHIKIEEALHPKHLEILNESHMHNVPSNSETHFKLVVVTDQFDTHRWTRIQIVEKHG